ncbi:MAG: xanthine dehydrogenase family protein molybdopterin-binding subunit [Dehalococcoidia bacterium]
MVTTQKPKYNVIGTRPVRPDGVDKVTGRALYGADLRLPGMLFGRIKRSPHAHAIIKRIDVSKARALPGVKAIVTAADLPEAEDKVQNLGEGSANLRELSNNVLASGKVLYRGHAVAAVAAVNVHVALEALDLIEVDYEVLPAVLDPREAMLPEAPLLHEGLRTRSVAGPGDKPTNVASHTQFVFGDAEKAFADCDEIVEREFSTKMVHQGYIEPHASTAMWNSDGQITIWTSTQGPFVVRAQCAEVLRHPISKVKVVPMEIGGGFGGKIPVYLDPVASILSRMTGKPVKIQMDRTEVFEGTGPTSGTSIKLKMGATKDGKIVAAQADLAYEAGAYPGSPVAEGSLCLLAPYDIEHVKIDAYDVVVNKPKVTAYRAPGAPAAMFAGEQVVDELAERLGIDPLKFRVMNTAHEGTRGPGGIPYVRIGHEECVEAALDSAHYNAPLEGENRGRGVASGFWFNAGLRSSVTVTVQPDGTVSLIEGSTDIGGTRASLAMQLAETLGVAFEDVKPTVVDTDSVGYNDVTGGSRVTYGSGMAVHEAGLVLQREMVQRLARPWQCAPEDIECQDGRFRTKDGAKDASFKDAAKLVVSRGPGVTASASVHAGGFGAGAFATHIVDVEVDPETGKVTILRYTAVQDAGTAIHPSYVEGQMQGGVVQGIGWALNEEYFYDDQGRMANSSFLDYRMPTTLDVPMIDTIIVEVPSPNHPFGVRGVGEVPIVPPLAAIANAVYRATGVRQTQLPMSPRRILETTLGIA